MPPYDLATRAGCLAYVQEQLLPSITRVFDRTGSFSPSGVVFATRLNTKQVKPTPVHVGMPGIGNRAIRRVITQMVERTVAKGCVFARQDEFPQRGGVVMRDAVVVQLEHQAFADQVWIAHVTGRRLEPFTGPLELASCPLDVNPGKTLASRWQS